MKTTRGTCPICDRPTHADHAPFCSQGCRDRDLLQWLGEGYRLPGLPVDPMEADGLDRGDSPD